MLPVSEACARAAACAAVESGFASAAVEVAGGLCVAVELWVVMLCRLRWAVCRMACSSWRASKACSGGVLGGLARGVYVEHVGDACVESGRRGTHCTQ